MRVWDVRALKPMHSYFSRAPPTCLDISQRGLLAVGSQRRIQVRSPNNLHSHDLVEDWQLGQGCMPAVWPWSTSCEAALRATAWSVHRALDLLPSCAPSCMSPPGVAGRGVAKVGVAVPSARAAGRAAGAAAFCRHPLSSVSTEWQDAVIQKATSPYTVHELPGAQLAQLVFLSSLS